ACSVVESVCRSILIESNLDLPAKQDISGLYRAVREPLGVSPTKEGLPDAIAEDVRNTLSGLITAVQSIGALRTHGGDAHGRERGFKRVDARIARLAIHSASAVSLFLIETWKLKFPERALRKE
ncbi:MAG: abortive phage resistance protein, partial [Mesorhizobium sp.]